MYYIFSFHQPLISKGHFHADGGMEGRTPAPGRKKKSGERGRE